MGVKRLLSDTDSQRGIDARFATAVVLGKVAKIECTDKRASVRVIMPDRVDHEGTPIISKPIPVLQLASLAKRSFAVPRLNDQVVLIKLANATSDYLVVGSFYTSTNKPPVTDPLLDYTEWEGGHTQKFDANDGAEVFLTQDFKGGWRATIKKDVLLKTTDGAKFNVEADGDVLIKSGSGNIVVESPTGTVTIKQDTIVLQATSGITLQGPLTILGNIEHTGNMHTTGVHQDSLGFHTGAAGAGTEMWNWTSGTMRAAPTGQVGLDAGTWEAASVVRLSKVAANNRDMSAVLAAVFVAGNEIFLQLKTDAARFGRYVLTDNGTDFVDFVEYGVALLESGGAVPGNNAQTTVTAVDVTSPYGMRLRALEARIAALEGALP